MASSNKVAGLFSSVKYSTIEDVLSHASEISARIKPVVLRKPYGPRNLSPLQRKVFELAPRFLKGHYDVKGITVELVKEKNAGSVSLERKKVGGAISHLVKMGILPVSQRYKSPSAPILRNVSSEEVKSHAGLVHKALNGGVSFHGKVLLSGKWRQSLSYDDAFQIGFNALGHAMARQDSAKAKLSTYAMPRIGRAVSRAASKIAKQQRTVSMDALSWSDGDTTLHDEIPSVLDPQESRSDLRLLLKSRRLKAHHLALWALVNVFGHSTEELGKYYGTSRQAIHSLKMPAEKYLANANKSS